MLRARKKDVRIKPNRKLDKRSSRGMLYENEELRLRTIEINAEVERGQTDIKKLRRENDHLRREMWALRDEYERLEKLIKHLDLAGTGSEHHHHRGQHHSDGEGGGGTGREDYDEEDDDDEDRASQPSLNGRNSNSEGSEDDDREADDTEPVDGVPMGISRSKSQTAMSSSDFHHSTSAPASANSKLDSACYCHDATLASANCDLHRISGLGGAVYVECGNPDKDNIENYQKAYGRMPRRCSSAGAKVYVSTQHFHPHTSAPAAPASSSAAASADANSRVCYESLSAVKSRYSTSGMEDEDGYAACSHPVRVDLREFLHPVEHPSGCPNHFSVEAGHGMMPPNTPPPPIPSPVTPTTITTAIHHPARRGDDLAVDEGESSGVDPDDEGPSNAIASGAGFPPDTPSEDGEFNLDHLVNIVRSFQQEQQLHQSGLIVATCSGSPPTPTSPDVLVEEAEDDASSNRSSSPGASGMATIKRRPLSSGNAQQQQRHRQMAIIEKESAGGRSAVDVVTEMMRSPRAIAESSSTDVCGSSGRATGWSSVPQRRNSFSSSTSSSASGSPTATHSSTVVFLNNNNNNTNNINNNKKLAGSSGYLGSGRGGSLVQGPDTTMAVTATTFSTTTTTTIDGIVVTSTRKSSSPIRIVHPSHVLPLPPPPVSSYDVPRALEPAAMMATHQGQQGAGQHSYGGALSRRRADETGRGLGDGNCLSVYPLPDGDASASLLRLHAVDPHTVSFDLKDLTAARSVTVQEVIDQLEQQLDPTRCHVRGVRMLAGTLFFISLDSFRSLQYLLRHSFRLRGHRVRLTDVSAQTWIVSLSGVPHYISDATVSLLLAAFGTIVGDVERRFFHGVDTGERLVRFRLKGHAKLPRHITVGGCRIQVRRMSPAPNSSQRDLHSDMGGFGPGPVNTLNPTGMNRRIRLDSQADDDNSTDFAFSSTAPEPATSSTVTGESHYGTIQSNSADSGRKSGPKIGRSFEYRSQLRVDLRMSAEVPVPSLLSEDPPSSSTGSAATVLVAQGNRVSTTPNCPVCEQQQHSTLAQSTPGGLQPQIRPQLATPQPTTAPPMVIHRCRHHESGVVGSPVGPGVPVAVPSSAVPSGEGRVHRESPPKSRVSVNFDETAAISSGSRISSGTGTSRPSNTKTSTSTSSNGILRKSVSGEEPATESGNDGSNSATGSTDGGQGKGKNGLRLGAAKKTARSFSLVDTFRVNKERRKPVVRVETVIENTSAANPEEGVRTLVVRRDSTESSSRSSRSSRKSNELPWCGCWGNGCL
ncbi:uncharacterized protein LOC124195637 [Daphnia pulex]|uniref:uncharacterized protein LOC124195637 n=1 Tax=Daphnia pulex TaxID=6669 RepID=UPI001EDFDC6C|nr:uncharacterized protein LOC124195637 [Daphnia pulex]